IPPTDKSAGPSRSCGHGRPQSGETDTSPADKRQLKIFKVEKISLEQKLSPGQIYSNGKDVLAVGTKDGAVSILDLQLEGKKRMDVRAFLAGFRNPEQYKCV
ncbi:MAG: hypothetical protein J5737_07585, partial [Bacteroidales bacterium]|nr:hypothetical protein [Bacteroidales bacterium]